MEMEMEMPKAECRELSDAELDSVVAGSNALFGIAHLVGEAVMDAKYGVRW